MAAQTIKALFDLTVSILNSSVGAMELKPMLFCVTVLFSTVVYGGKHLAKVLSNRRKHRTGEKLDLTIRRRYKASSKGRDTQKARPAIQESSQR